MREVFVGEEDEVVVVGERFTFHAPAFKMDSTRFGYSVQGGVSVGLHLRYYDGGNGKYASGTYSLNT
ncbi:hypothetical protein F2Q69_00015375 [Brassica cretica]|uniref:Uncharacterized protein n=1 Tax=Brassica cretica TaxID=69181 RepID=A0A8S9R8D2_BRACR|nr:hypothetical protein F2Q69_00015375 [Brassica cretica]